MAIFKKGVLGSLSGMIGPVVIATWRKIVYMRGKPRVQKKSKDSSTAQTAARGKFKYLNQILLPFQSYIYIGFNNVATDKTELNAAFSANFYTAVTGVYPKLSIDCSLLNLSTGTLLQLIDPEVSYGETGLFEIKWKNDEYTKGSYYSDQIVLVVYEPRKKRVDGTIGGAQRGDGQCSFQVNDNMKFKPVHLYIFMTSLNRRRISNTQYLGLFSL